MKAKINMVFLPALVFCVICGTGYCDDSTPRRAAEMMQNDGSAKMPADAVAAYAASKETMIADRNILNDDVENYSAIDKPDTMAAGDSFTFVADEAGKIPDGSIPGISKDVSFAPGTVVTYSEGTITIGDISSFLANTRPDGFGAGMVSADSTVPAGGVISGGGTFSIIETGQLPAQLNGYTSGSIVSGTAMVTTSTVTPAAGMTANQQQDQSSARFTMDRVQKQRQAVREVMEGKKKIEEE